MDLNSVILWEKRHYGHAVVTVFISPTVVEFRPPTFPYSRRIRVPKPTPLTRIHIPRKGLAFLGRVLY